MEDSALDPGPGTPVELQCADTPGLFDLRRTGKGLVSQSSAPKQTPPRFLEIEPTGAYGNEHLVDARMAGEPLLNGKCQDSELVLASSGSIG